MEKKKEKEKAEKGICRSFFFFLILFLLRALRESSRKFAASIIYSNTYINTILTSNTLVEIILHDESYFNV